MYNAWLKTMNWAPNGETDPIKVLTRIFADNLTGRDPDSFVEETLLWRFVEQLRLVERDELVFLSYNSLVNCYNKGTRKRADDFYKSDKTTELAYKLSRANTDQFKKKGKFNPVKAILMSAKDKGCEGRTISGKWIVVDANVMNVDNPHLAPEANPRESKNRRERERRAAKKRADSTLTSTGNTTAGDSTLNLSSGSLVQSSNTTLGTSNVSSKKYHPFVHVQSRLYLYT